MCLYIYEYYTGLDTHTVVSYCISEFLGGGSQTSRPGSSLNSLSGDS